MLVSNCGSLTLYADKKNENKEVAVDDFLGAESAVKAIGHSIIPRTSITMMVMIKRPCGRHCKL
jgi:hypothetical protein